jgi:hypothetical protein
LERLDRNLGRGPHEQLEEDRAARERLLQNETK